MGMDGSPGMPFTRKTHVSGWPSRPLGRPPVLEAGLSGLTGCSIGRQKLLNEGCPRLSYWGPKSLLPRPFRSHSLIPMGERLKKFVDE